MKPNDYLEAARVPATLQPQEFGLWSIARHTFTRETLAGAVQIMEVGWDSQTVLRHMTEATMHLDGEIVMEDGISELRRHLPIWLAAHGRVLITGLGLGCVVRGLLASPRVEHIDVLEIDADIIRIVGAEFSGNQRVTIHHADALKLRWPEGTKWDCAWHDLWMDAPGPASLHLAHAKLLHFYRGRVQDQGAWQFPRFMKRVWPKSLLGA